MVSDFIERVRTALKQKGVTARGVAQRAGLHRNTLCNIDREDWNPTADVLKKLEPHIIAIENGEWIEPPADEPEQVAA
jgi:3,4-dihydroxy 2-butanone 4-phosphate synthase/GTP cyclohydrolase II